MAKKTFLVDIDLSQNQLTNAKVHSLPVAPTSPAPVEGQMYFNTTDKKMYVYNNTSWVDALQQNSSTSTSLSTGTVTGTTYGIDSDGGSNDVIISSANATDSGVMSAGKFNEVNANNVKISDINHNVSTNLSEGTNTTTSVNVNSSDGTNATILQASPSRAGVMSSVKFNEIGINTAKVSDVNHNVSTNITTAHGSTTVNVNSSDGTNGTINSANGTTAGVMTAGIYNNHITNNAKVSDINHNVNTNLSTSTTTTTVTVNSSDGTNALIPQVVANGQAGVVSGSDKTKINNAVLTTDTTTSGIGFVIDEDSMSSNSATKVPTQQSVKAYVDANLSTNDAMIFKGTIGTGGTLTLSAFNSLTVYNTGDTYRVITDGTYKGIVSEVGDLFISTVDRLSGGIDADWTVVQTNIDGAVVGPSASVNNRVAFFDGVSGKLLKDSGLALSGTNTGDEPNATISTKGIIEIATLTEVNTGIDTIRAVTPSTLKDSLGITPTLSTTLTYSRLLNETTSTIVVTHSIGNQFVQVQVYKTSSNEMVVCEVALTSVNTVTLKFNVAPTTNEYRVVIIG